MYVSIVPIQVKEGHKEEFVKASLLDAQGSVNDEPGCLRFDLIQDPGDPNRVWLYEIYKDEAAFQAHTQAPHFLKWRDTVQDWREEGPGVSVRGGPTYGPRTPIGNREEACTY